ncbi:MAG: four helix bundle protein [Candidatus Magasanikbacteria bacterium]|uniref:Four helix bundle protein n=1 Tax=Candidatus Magasanikbacteria bacterium CG10_big_fil_rev_8_21_14_0_10_38_6 TaxID=1974647 RepID=A0A2M6P250_9BACT|nr:four helix bundle protein [Candidatus Magasanikbacteria bacterium]NCS72146.1 four helix bundle protein [Candidatus Magasanikbacteria bacterium]PIR77764.1 MAG: four helix bundle protein [Candidatus Magasanikbacteria bacterium CG10_big_fil_rev_8_21_14_0_10_38_6]
MKTYKDLIVWQKSMVFVYEIYTVTKIFPSDEKFGLSSQLRRAAISIPSNIAEGYARKTKRDNAHFITIAFGSATEIETQLLISKQLSFIHDEVYISLSSLLTEILRMLYKYRESLYR